MSLAGPASKVSATGDHMFLLCLLGSLHLDYTNGEVEAEWWIDLPKSEFWLADEEDAGALASLQHDLGSGCDVVRAKTPLGQSSLTWCHVLMGVHSTG